MRRKINYKIKRTPWGHSLYVKGGTKYIWSRQKLSHKRLLSGK